MIAKAGKPLVKVIPLNDPAKKPKKRMGFMAGQISVPVDFDRMGGAAIQQIFLMITDLGDKRKTDE